MASRCRTFQRVAGGELTEPVNDTLNARLKRLLSLSRTLDSSKFDQCSLWRSHCLPPRSPRVDPPWFQL